MNGIREGNGSFIWKDGDKYVGLYRNDKRNGKGILKLRTGKYYDGIFKDDNFENGKLVYEDRDYYEGGFKNYKRHGQGKVFNHLNNQIRCEGEFKNDEYQKNILAKLKSLLGYHEPHCY